MGHMPRVTALPSAALVATGLVLSGSAALSFDSNPPAPDHSASVSTANSGVPLVDSPGFAVLTDIRSARIALVNRNTPEASRLLTDAASRLRTRLNLSANSQTAPGVETWLRVDGQVLVADHRGQGALQGTPQGTPNEPVGVAGHVPAASPDGSGDFRGPGDFQVTFSEILMPVNATLSQVLKARQLMTKRKYYEANALLDRVEAQLRVQNTPLAPPAPSANPAEASQ